MSQARVYLIPPSALTPILRGEKRIANLPADAEIVAADGGPNGLGVRVHSKSFAAVAFGTPLPIVTAVLEKR